MTPFDVNRLYLFMANGWVSIPKERKFIDNLYQSQKIRFYNQAKANSLYNDDLLQDRPLDVEVTIRRAFGILLCSQDDEELQNAIIEELYRMYPPIKKLCAKFSFDKYKVLEEGNKKQAVAKNLGADETGMFIWAVVYIIYCKYGFDSNNADIECLYQGVAEIISHLCTQRTDNMRRIVEAYNPKESMIIPRELRKLQESILDGKDINDLISIYEVFCSPAYASILPVNSLPLKNKQNLLQSISPEFHHDCISALTSVVIMCLQFQFQGLSFTSFFEEVEFSKEERNTSLKIVAQQLNEVYHGSNRLFRFDYYLQALVFGKIAKFIKETKEFYFANNRETQYNELRKVLSDKAVLQEENDKLIRVLQDKDRTIESLKSQIHMLSTDVSKDIKEAQRPLNNAIAILQSQVASLQEELEAEREKSVELNRLREFAFSIQSGADVSDVETPLKDLIAGKRIYIIGGHINWRNKMKSAYPSLNFLDGHQKSFDAKMLIDADMVFLNTSNMSHTVYYKVMAVLQKNRVPFNYIGRYMNIELLEQEISKILQES